MIIIDKSLCPQNHSCPAIGVCSAGVITQVNYELPVIDSQKCIECGQCVSFCPMGAIRQKS
jgi:Fe-S-cluster-containing hydrogenase component 2